MQQSPHTDMDSHLMSTATDCTVSQMMIRQEPCVLEAGVSSLYVPLFNAAAAPEQLAQQNKDWTH